MSLASEEEYSTDVGSYNEDFSDEDLLVEDEVGSKPARKRRKAEGSEARSEDATTATTAQIAEVRMRFTHIDFPRDC